MIIPKIVIIKTTKGQKYADFIAKEINLAGGVCGIIGIKSLEKYLEKNGCFPKETVIHSRTANPNKIYKILKNLEQQGYRIINSASAIKLTSDKFNSCVYAKEKEIPCAVLINEKRETKTAAQMKLVNALSGVERYVQIESLGKVSLGKGRSYSDFVVTTLKFN